MSSIDIEDVSRHNKRRRWNGDISAATGNRDLAQKTLENEGFLSSDDDDEKKKKGKSQARKEQQLGMRSFHHRTAAKGNSNNIEEMSLGGGGWTPSLPNNNLMERSNSNSNNSGRAYKTPRPPSNVSKASGFTLSSVADNGGKNSNNKRNPYGKNKKTHAIKSTTPFTSSLSSTTRSTKSRRSNNTHIVCAISENIARETCVTSLDASRPTYLVSIELNILFLSFLISFHTNYSVHFILLSSWYSILSNKGMGKPTQKPCHCYVC